jgi:imidazolonepropionase-like amidohydrolase
MRCNRSRLFAVVFIPLVFLVLPIPLSANPEIPGAVPEKPIAIVGATLHPVVGSDVPAGTIICEKGKIVAIGNNVTVPEGAQRIDATGKHVYPALFDAYTDMGLVEINSIRATIDSLETGSINPNVKAWVAVNPDSEIIPVTRSNGVLLTLTAPSGGLIAGRSAVIQLDGWTFEDLTLRADTGMHINWPSESRRRFGAEEETAKPTPRGNPLEPLREAFHTARAYQKARQSDPDRHAVDIRWQAMLPVLERNVPLIVSADSAVQIQSAIAFSIEQNVKLIIHGGYDSPDCVELLKKHQVPVIVSGTYRLPQRESDNYDAPFTVPDRLRQAGIRYCISSTGKFGASGVRNLPYHAAMAAAFGLPVDEALRAITLYPAQILGVADRVGSLEVGKDATLIVTTGDPLETSTQVEGALIQGRPVDLNDRHKRLWHKYEEKYKSGVAKP